MKMSSRTYEIKRWDGIILPSVGVPQPGLYIQPDAELLSLLESQGQIAIKIINTRSVYDNKLTYATIRPSELTGGSRPNYQQQTGYMVILPNIPWDGYPNQLGSVEVLDFALFSSDNESDDLQSEPESQVRLNLIHTTRCLFFVMLCILLFIIYESMG